MLAKQVLYHLNYSSSPFHVRVGFFFFFWYWGLNSGPTPWTTQPALFSEGFFKIGSHELFAQAGCEPRSSWSLPPESLGLQVWAIGAQPRLFFESSFRFTVKLGGKYREFPCTPDMHSLPHYQHPPTEWGISYNQWAFIDTFSTKIHAYIRVLWVLCSLWVWTNVSTSS
jgi:hypothetical protein